MEERHLLLKPGVGKSILLQTGPVTFPTLNNSHKETVDVCSETPAFHNDLLPAVCVSMGNLTTQSDSLIGIISCHHSGNLGLEPGSPCLYQHQGLSASSRWHQGGDVSSPPTGNLHVASDPDGCRMILPLYHESILFAQ